MPAVSKSESKTSVLKCNFTAFKKRLWCQQLIYTFIAYQRVLRVYFLTHKKFWKIIGDIVTLIKR